MGHEEMGRPWVSLTCPGCKAKMRIKAAYAHLRGRCPNCGLRIEAPEPKPYTPPVISDADEPIGLVPLEDEEWPEPAQLEGSDEPGLYNIFGPAPAPPLTPTSAPPPTPVTPAALAKRVEGYGLATNLPPTAAPLPQAIPVTPGYVADQAPERPALPQQEAKIEEELDLIRRKPASRAQRPLLDGVYSFPWRPSSATAWLVLSAAFSLLAIFAVVIAELINLQGPFLIGIALAGPLLIVCFIWAGTSGSDLFLLILEQTAGGEDHLPLTGRMSLVENFGKLLYVLWMAACAFIPIWLLWDVLLNHFPSQPIRLFVLFAPVAVLFPVMVVSSLWSGSRWTLFQREAVGGLARQPGLLIALVLQSLALISLPVVLGCCAILGISYLLAAVFGPVAAACVLIYARFLGRVEAILAEEASRRNRKRKRRPEQPPTAVAAPVTSPPASWPPPPAP